MTIVHLYKDYAPVLGGIENHIRVVAEAQVRAGHDVTVLVCAPGRRTQHEQLVGVRVIKAGRLATVASMPLSLAQPWLLRRLRPDIVHIQEPYPLGTAANWLLGRARATVITYQCDIVRQARLMPLYGPVLSRALAAADRVLVSSPRYLTLSTWLRPVQHKCVAVPLGIEIGLFPMRPAEHQTGSRLLFVGRLRYYKGLDTLLEALALVPEATLTVVGSGPLEGALKAQAARLGVAPRVVFTGEVADAELSGLYHQADVFVLPSNSRAEAYGLVLLEAMASGLPCITTELGTGTSWIVRHGVTGLVVPPQDASSLAAAIRSLAANPTRCAAMGRAGRARVESTFQLDQMVRRIESIYEEVLADRN